MSKDQAIERGGERVHSKAFLWGLTPQKEIDYSDETGFEVILRAKEWLPIHWVAKHYGIIEGRRFFRPSEERAKCFIHDGQNPTSLAMYYRQHEINGFKCWACGASGDVVDFVRRLEDAKRPPVQKLRELMDIYNGNR